VHVAFGNSANFGGTVSVPVHLDVCVVEPTLDIGGTRVLEAGRFVLDA
jgi:leucyl aminopeptidase (aminopeptidase T)